ncbi:MAG: hypothetical protein VKK42_05230 [Lyngbya sp.]|nr:hypothetical protein [Lyngbya sp.]
MSQTTAFMGGCMFTVMTALLLLIGWLLFGDLPSSNSKDSSESNNNQPYGVLPFNPSQPNQPFGTIPFGPPQPSQPYGSLQLPPPPSLTPAPSNPSDSSNNNSDSQLQNQLQQQQNTTQQLTTQLERHRMQIEQLTTQTERQRMQIEQLTSQTEQQRIKNDQLLMQLNEQQRMMTWTGGSSRPFPVQPTGPTSNIQTAVLWVLVGIVVALFLGGSIFILSLIFVLTQPQRRSSTVKKYPMQPINFAWPYAFYDDQTDLLPPPVKTRRNR